MTGPRPVVVETRNGLTSYARLTDGRFAGAVVFEPCPADTRAFGGGAVGRFTGFAGGFVVPRPGCLLVIVTRGARHWVRTVPIGVERCG